MADSRISPHFRTTNHEISNQSAIPVIVFGKLPAIATVVVEGLKPEYEVIHCITCLEMGLLDLPAILNHQPPPSLTSTTLPNCGLGTANFSALPKAFVAGGGYTDSEVAAMRDAIARDSGTGGGVRIPWVRADIKSHPPGGPNYAKETMEKAKARLAEVVVGGEGEDGGVFWF